MPASVNGAVISTNSQNIVIHATNFQILIPKNIPEISIVSGSSNYSITYSDILLMQNNNQITMDYPLSGIWTISQVNGTNQQYGRYIEIIMNRLLEINDFSSLNITFQFLIASKTYNKTIPSFTGVYTIPVNNSTLNINILISQSGHIASNYIILKQQYSGFEKSLKFGYMQNRNKIWSNIPGKNSLSMLSGPENYMSVGLVNKENIINTYGWSNYLSGNAIQNFSTYYSFNNNILNIFFFYPNSPTIVHDPEINLPGSIFSTIHAVISQARQFILDNIYSLVTGMFIAIVIISIGFISIRKKD
ncbi:MAG: hypothetical protein ACP5NL_06015 [Thermoplasmata archaeon]